MKIRCLFDEMVSVKKLKPHPQNRNKHPDVQITRLAEILEYQGWRYPIKVSKLSGYITSGHGRLMAAQKLGLKEVPVNFQEYESVEQEYADLTADNAIALWAEIDFAAINADLPDLGPDFNIDMLGLKDFILEPAEKLEPGCDPDDIPEKVEPKTKLGDLYELGSHRLLCGDSTDILQVENLMNGHRADMVFTDPPYGIGIDADYGARMKGKEGFIKRAKKSYSNIIGDDKDFDPTWILGYFQESSIFLWGANNYAQKLPKGQWFVWYKKTTDGMKKMFGWDFELCWTNQKAGQVYEQAWAGCFGHNKKLDGDTKTHPSMKSVSLIEKCFNDYPGENVIDLFGGSGSTLIACEKTNRKCFMMELDPHYCDVIVARWEKFTGKKAVLKQHEIADGV
jgi:DNA modification methylase